MFLGCGISQDQYDSLVSSVEEKRNEINSVTDEIDRLGEISDRLLNDISEKQQEIADVEGELDSIEQEIVSSTEYADKVAHDLSVSEQQLQSLVDQKSMILEEIGLVSTSVEESIVVLRTIYNGIPFTELSNGSWLTLWCYRDNISYISLPIEYLPDRKFFVVRALEPGRYEIYAIFDAYNNTTDLPFNPSHAMFPGDYWFGLQFSVPDEPVVQLLEFPGQVSLHLSSPVDNAMIQGGIDNVPSLVLSQDIHIEFDNIEGADTYQVKIYEYNSGTGMNSIVLNETVTDTVFDTNLAPSAPNSWYTLYINAINQNGAIIGTLNMIGENFYGGNLPFRVQ
ncbi:MAG: hypothetical protein JSU58_09625 [Dehalococcoidales bacterium]|nr:MAG: hypothetical protein JSU58_09625 [Dehalococcoidales bacterium]